MNKIFQFLLTRALVALLVISCAKEKVTPFTVSVATVSVTTITATTAVSGGIIAVVGNGTITARGVCWATTQNPTLPGSFTSDGTGTSSYASSLTGLTPNTVYYVRAYATDNSNHTTYGNQVSFTTPVSFTVTVTTTAATLITSSTASSGGSMVTTGTGSIAAKGVCWATTQNPTIAANFTSDGTGATSFASSLTGLMANTIYYVRAYVTDNSNNTTYGNQVSFTTAPSFTITLTTTGVTAITSSSAMSGGSMVTSGTGSITAKGVCWATTQNPTITGNLSSDGTGTNAYASSLTGLTANTTYYVRAYVTDNNNNTTYGNQLSFTTAQSFSVTVTTTAVTLITTSSALSGGSMVTSGTGSIASKGVCWSTSPNPTLSGSYTSDGTGANSYSSSMTGLTASTTYYVRAYAIDNNNNTTYGNQVAFTTSNITAASLNGLWDRGDIVIQISGGVGTFYSISSSSRWSQILSDGLITIGSDKLMNIAFLSQATWTCSELWNTTSLNGDTIEWSYNGSITMSADGNTITVSSVEPGVGGSPVPSTYTRK